MSDVWKDPIVEEVRVAREKIAEECHFSFGVAIERARRVQEQWEGPSVTKRDLTKARTPVSDQAARTTPS